MEEPEKTLESVNIEIYEQLEGRILKQTKKIVLKKDATTNYVPKRVAKYTTDGGRLNHA